MKYLLLSLLLATSLSNSADYTPDYRIAKGNVYQIHDNKAYKVIVSDGEYLTTNEWFPLDEKGYTKEHIQKVKERQAKHANDFLRANRED